jgi:hypothetical protein
MIAVNRIFAKKIQFSAVKIVTPWTKHFKRSGVEDPIIIVRPIISIVSATMAKKGAVNPLWLQIRRLLQRDHVPAVTTRTSLIEGAGKGVFALHPIKCGDVRCKFVSLCRLLERL